MHAAEPERRPVPAATASGAAGRSSAGPLRRARRRVRRWYRTTPARDLAVTVVAVTVLLVVLAAVVAFIVLKGG